MEKIEKLSDLRKVPITEQAEDALHRMLTETNDGFNGGKVSKADLLSWLILHFEKHSFSDVRDDIRQVYFDKVAYLSSIVGELKKAQKAGAPEPDLQSLLAPLSGKKS